MALFQQHLEKFFFTSILREKWMWQIKIGAALSSFHITFFPVLVKFHSKVFGQWARIFISNSSIDNKVTTICNSRKRCKRSGEILLRCPFLFLNFFNGLVFFFSTSHRNTELLKPWISPMLETPQWLYSIYIESTLFG